MLMRKLVRDKDRNQVSDRVLDASLSSNPKCKSTCETCAPRPSALTADRRIVLELLPESDKVLRPTVYCRLPPRYGPDAFQETL